MPDAAVPEVEIDSPRLRTFARSSLRGGSGSVERAWAALCRDAVPIVEPVPGSPDRRRVTFVWRPGAPLRHATIYSPVANALAGEMAMRRVGQTGVWYRSFVLPERTRALYAFSRLALPAPDGDGSAWGPFFQSLEADPGNPEGFTMAKDPDDPEDVEVRVSTLSLPAAPPQLWTRPRTSTAWRVETARLPSRALGSARTVDAYLPPPSAGGPVNLVLVLDGPAYRSAIPAPTIVENLVAAGKIGPSAVVLVGNAPHAREAELAHNPQFARFLAEELLPWIREHLGVRCGAEGTVVAGSSLGGLTAAYAAYRSPELFGNVLAQSGAFLFTAPGAPDGAATLMDEYARAPAASTRFYLDAGTMETTVYPGTQMSLLAGVRYLRDVLLARGYMVNYAEFEGGHDYACWATTFADGLIALLGGRGGARLDRSVSPRA